MSTPEGAWGKGYKATVKGSGDSNLHGPLLSGSWSLRIYELGLSHPIQTDTGDLLKAVAFLDEKSLRFEFRLCYASVACRWKFSRLLRSTR